MLEFTKDIISLFFYIFSFFLPQNRDFVLLYHSVSDMNAKNDPLRLNIQPKLFEKQMAYLSKLQKDSRVLVAFDDGFENFFSNAFFTILKYNIKSIIFVTAGFIDGEISFNRLFNGGIRLGPLTWEQLKRIADFGVEVGSHALSHRNLAALDDRELYREIADSKKIIENKIGREVKYFAYPYGARNAFNGRVIQFVRDSGYQAAYTNIMGFNTAGSTDIYRLNRIRIYSNDNMFRFKMKIRGSYNWVDYVLAVITKSKKGND